MRLLHQASNKVRRLPNDAVPVPPAHWLPHWQRLATVTDGIQKADIRFQVVMQALDECDRAFAANDHPKFLDAVQRVERAVTR